ncbi:MAG: phosphatase PAP2 family protein [Pseudomonadota bacterium]
MRAAMVEELLGKRALARLAWLLTLSAVLILLIGTTELDLRLADAMYDARLGAFPWNHAWLTERFGHGILKVALTILAVLPVLACLWDLLPRQRRRLPVWWRLRMRLLALCAILVPTIISLLKQASHSHCPWDLQRYGGSQPYYHLLEQIPEWVDAGHCLPGGHASSALWLLGLVVFWLPHRPRTAAMVAVLTLAFGAAVGWMQQMRGAHFLTHTLWSMWIAAAVVTLLLLLARYRRAAARALQGTESGAPV